MNRSKILLVGATLAAGITTPAALADQERFAMTHPTWNEECGSCHVAYPPQLLPAASWEALLGDLGNHFGSDASLDPATAAELLAYARMHASARTAAGEPTLRITRTRWFLHEHDEIGPATWQRPAIGSPANCAACHRGADSGDYSERRIKIPR
ncbi:MAG: diheme cytochrome c [Nevskiales bacterium]|nr:diheme cytochrome c [Nevskiales bacterium]